MAEVELTLLIPSTVHPSHASAPHRALLGSGTNLDVTGHHSALGNLVCQGQGRGQGQGRDSINSHLSLLGPVRPATARLLTGAPSLPININSSRHHQPS